METLDLVVPVREGPVNQPLRYALRSWAAHLAHRRVWVVGHLHPWAAGVGHIPLVQGPSKHENTAAAVRAACLHPEVSDPFLLCNDDFFVLRPTPVMPVLHRGRARQVEEDCEGRVSDVYLDGMRATRELLADLGHPDPLSYELHLPMPIRKAGMLDALAIGRHLPVLLMRTVYGVLNQVGGLETADVKISHRGPRGFDRDARFLSTMPDSFTNGAAGQLVRERFPAACRYEDSGRR